MYIIYVNHDSVIKQIFKLRDKAFLVNETTYILLKFASVFSQKSRKMYLVRTFCSFTAKTSRVTPIFYFMILIRTMLPFSEKKYWHKSMFSFSAILLNCTDWAITCRIARVQFNSTLDFATKWPNDVIRIKVSHFRLYGGRSQIMV